MKLNDVIGGLFNRTRPGVLLAEPAAPEVSTEKPEVTHVVVQTQSAPAGVSGTEKFGGVFTEDYFRQLQGSKKAKEYDKMRRGDARVKMCLAAIKSPMRSANWHFQPAEQDDTSMLHADFLNFVFKEDIGVKRKKKFKTVLNEAFSACDFGHAVFERVHKTANHPKFGTYIGLKQIGWRHPKTIEAWHTNSDGELESVEQHAYGDIGNTVKTVKMNADFLNIITLDEEGDNFEGISLLRPCYGAWSRKQMYLKLMAIGMERMAIPTPKVKVPSGKEASEEFNNMIDVLERLTSHQCNYVTYPEGWDLDFLIAAFDPDKCKSSIQFENEEMTFAFLANFLLLGAGGNGGAYALSEDLSDFFTKSVLYIADMVAEEFTKMGRELIDLNYGPQEKYPNMVAQGIVDEISEGFGNLLKSLTDSKHITPDDNLENEIRRRMKLMPMRDEDMGKRDKKPATEIDPITGLPIPPVDPADPNKPPVIPDADDETDDETEDDETDPPAPSKKKKKKDAEPAPADKKVKLTDVQRDRIVLAESKAQQKIGSAQDRVRVLMKKHIKLAASGMIESIIANYKDLPESRKIEAINGIELKGLRDYQAALKQELTDIAFEAIEGARREVPKAKKVKLAEFESLPKSVRLFLNMQSRVMASSTYADLEKYVFLQYGNSVGSTDSANLIEQDLMEAAESYVGGSSVTAAGGNLGAGVVNTSRTAFFFDEEVLEEIESFTFVNGDPVSPICQEMAGQTCSKADVESQRLFPPLHHNCKSYLIVNLVGDKNNPPITGFSTKHTPGL